MSADNVVTEKTQESNLEESLEKQTKLTQEYLDLLQRTQADFKNYKQRIEKETQEIIFLEVSKIFSEFLSYRDTITKALSKETNEPTKEVLSLMLTNFDNILKRQGLERIDVLNKDFDFSVCDCIFKQDVEKEKNNKVLEIIEEGFTFKKKLIKPAKVVVGIYKEGEKNE